MALFLHKPSTEQQNMMLLLQKTMTDMSPAQQPIQQKPISKAHLQKQLTSENAVTKQSLKRKRSVEQISSNWEKFKQQQQQQMPTQKTPQYKKKKKPKTLLSLAPLPQASKEQTAIVAIDCEMVQCEEKFSCLARVSIVNYYGHVLIDSFIRPTKKITNYLTWVSGVTYQHIKDAPTLEEILPQIIQYLKNKTIVGHTVKRDLECVQFDPSQANRICDIATYKFLKNEQGKTMSLKKMAEMHLEISDFQTGQHDSVEDARVALSIFKKFEQKINSYNKERKNSYNTAKKQLLDDLKQQ